MEGENQNANVNTGANNEPAGTNAEQTKIQIKTIKEHKLQLVLMTF